ncbi:MAG: HAMP domain-containing protein, partial [Pseudomonadota bacterium]|nr:HAMP domain-containing protein [Pseudomonadota bacterium]
MSPDLARRLRYSTGPRFIALYLALTLLSAIPLFVFIYHQTDRLLVADAREVVAEHFNLLEAEHREGGVPQLAEFIAETVASGAAAHEAYLLVDSRGTPIAGNLSAWPPISPGEERWKELLLYRRGQDRPETIGFSIVHLPEGHRLLMGRVMDDRGRLREALITTLASALLLAIPIAFLGSMILLKFMTSRVEAMANAAARVASGDLQTRIQSHGTDDPFDRLAGALNA